MGLALTKAAVSRQFVTSPRAMKTPRMPVLSKQLSSSWLLYRSIRPVLMLLLLLVAILCVKGPLSPNEAGSLRFLSRLRGQPRTKGGSVAVCLAGGLRTLDLTVSSIVTHLFEPLAADVFVVSPIDHNTHKLLLLGQPLGSSRPFRRWKLKGVKLVPQAPFDETAPTAQMISHENNRKRREGILQYYELVEGCLSLIDEQERRQHYLYNWILRTRPDSYWVKPVPALSSIDVGESDVVVPAGCHFGGVNDRLFVARRKAAAASLKKLSALSQIQQIHQKLADAGTLTSEKITAKQLALSNLTVAQEDFHFCVLKKDYYEWPLKELGIPVFAVSSTAPLNGAYCQPCDPVARDEKALQYLSVLAKSQVPNDSPRLGMDLCDGGKDHWPASWKETYDAQAGPAAMATRKLYNRMTSVECQEQLRNLLSQVLVYHGLSAEMLCQLKHWEDVFEALQRERSAFAYVLLGQRVSVPIKTSQRSLPFTAQALKELYSPTGLYEPADGAVRIWSNFPGLEEEAAALNVVRKTGITVCHIVLPLQGNVTIMESGKASIKAELEAQGYDLIKCGGFYTSQLCVFASVLHCTQKASLLKALL